MKEEMLFVGTADAEHTEMYLKAIWHLMERGEQSRINSIAKMLNVSMKGTKPTEYYFYPRLEKFCNLV